MDSSPLDSTHGLGQGDQIVQDLAVVVLSQAEMTLAGQQMGVRTGDVPGG
jgi:hypothetical protein